MMHLPSVDYKERTNRLQISCDIVQLVIPYIMWGKKNLFDRSAARGTLRFSQFFKNAHEIKKLMTNNFLDVLVYIITEHFYSLFVFWLALYAQILHNW